MFMFSSCFGDKAHSNGNI
uniref:Uncharacterized protein n=1 Tax=Rhizophora mucronata TaxID=61149 RepID=A0A2P2P1C8_RHIMU